MIFFQERGQSRSRRENKCNGSHSNRLSPCGNMAPNRSQHLANCSSLSACGNMAIIGLSIQPPMIVSLSLDIRRSMVQRCSFEIGNVVVTDKNVKQNQRRKNFFKQICLLNKKPFLNIQSTSQSVQFFYSFFLSFFLFFELKNSSRKRLVVAA